MDSQLPTVWSVILAALPASIAAIASGIVAWKSYRTTKKMHDDDQKKRSNENIVADTKRKLEEFYYPYLLISQENKSLYEIFSKTYRANDENFRTLIELLKGREFVGNDKAILTRIIDNNDRLKDLINKNARVVDDSRLRDVLIKSATHYALIKLVFEGKIQGEVERFKDYVHPDDVYEAVANKTNELEQVIQNASQS